MVTKGLKMRNLLLSLLMLFMSVSTQTFAKKTTPPPVNEGEFICKMPLVINLTKDNSVLLNAPFDDLSMGQIIKELATIDNESGEPMYLVLNTPGGYISSGLNFYATAKSFNRPLHTITLFAASMGFQTAQNLGDRYIVEYGTLMSHKARGSFSGEFGGAGKSQLDSRYGLYKDILELLDKKTVERTNGKQTLASYQAAYENELWVLGEKAIEQGYADYLADIKCSSELLKEDKDGKIMTPFGAVEIKTSACPTDLSVRSIDLKVKTNKGSMPLNTYIAQGGDISTFCTDKSTNSNICIVNSSRISNNDVSSILSDVLNKTFTLDRLNRILVKDLGE